MEISEKIRELIDKKGVTPYQVSIDTNISQATLSKIMSGRTKKLSNKTAQVLSEYFGVEKNYLMGESNSIAFGTNHGTIFQDSGANNFFGDEATNNKLIEAKDNMIKQLQDEVINLKETNRRLLDIIVSNSK